MVKGFIHLLIQQPHTGGRQSLPSRAHNVTMQTDNRSSNYNRSDKGSKSSLPPAHKEHVQNSGFFSPPLAGKATSHFFVTHILTQHQHSNTPGSTSKVIVLLVTQSLSPLSCQLSNPSHPSGPPPAASCPKSAAP